MSVKRLKLQKPEADHAFIGLWHIYEMEMWDEDYFNMDVQAYIRINANNFGEFQFGLVEGGLNGWLETEERFAFTWEGCDEMDDASGSGWIELNGENEIEGHIAFHRGDRSQFKAKSA
ncbi:hypothetical protein [Spirulina sp. 06S082]|uniref:hypothetical protein n=1 Tax=Spirulina sp. 06S082 TaxID=3110248 RepID=UPI002B20E1D5|nr:hypothetical protein [Spirulina sp. 06S082]MEA5472396.1 hypothetical protein [Spirulina sp. 06S082]